jgi:UDP-2,4-diacetamido-2,4,6-trideoxy-beta-L-altropyranose hydrolase
MKVVIRTDASMLIGNGHVLRCLSLATCLRDAGLSVNFVMRPQEGDLCAFIEDQNFKVTRLPRPLKSIKPKHATDYESWLQTDSETDARDFLAVVETAELIIVDHYGIGSDWEGTVKRTINCRLIAIDDLKRDHLAELIIDPTLGRAPCDYASLKLAQARVLVGPRFALISKSFSILKRSKEAFPKLLNSNHRLLLSMGGADAQSATLLILKALAKRPINLLTTVLLNEGTSQFEEVRTFCEENSAWASHIPFTQDMAELMLNHSIAVGGAGTTSWERAAMGLPSVVIALAENQKSIRDGLVSAGAAVSIKVSEIEAKLNGSIDRIIKDYAQMRAINLAICDGLGCDRVLMELRDLGWIR